MTLIDKIKQAAKTWPKYSNRGEPEYKKVIDCLMFHTDGKVTQMVMTYPVPQTAPVNDAIFQFVAYHKNISDGQRFAKFKESSIKVGPRPSDDQVREQIKKADDGKTAQGPRPGPRS